MTGPAIRNPQVKTSPKSGYRAGAPKGYYGGGTETPKQRSDLLFLGQMPNRTRFRPSVSVRWGRRGRGKSVSLTAEGAHFQAAYAAKGLRFQVASNYQNDYADFTRPMLVEELIEFPDWGWDLRILLDEINLYIHRRRWQNVRNLNFEAFLQQVRKRRIEACLATQFPQRIDSDTTDQIDFFIDCEMIFEGCGHPDHRYCIMQRIHDWWGQWTGKTWRKPWPPNAWEWDWFKWFHNCNKFFDGFDTEQIFAAAWLPGGTQDRMLRQKWGSLIPDEAEQERLAAIADGYGPVHAEVKAELAQASQSGGEYNPDLTLGQPGPGRGLSDFLRSKALTSPGRALNAGGVLRAAMEVDPEIRTQRDLASFAKGMGWLIEREGGSTLMIAP
jgi:hypothetical protein